MLVCEFGVFVCNFSVVLLCKFWFFKRLKSDQVSGRPKKKKIRLESGCFDQSDTAASSQVS